MELPQAIAAPTLLSKDDKPPKGFEKFFRRPQEDKKAKAQDKKKEEDKKEKEEDLSEEEEVEKESKGKDKGDGEQSQGIKGYFLDPNGNPKNEFLLLLAMMLGTTAYLFNFSAPKKEITTQEFLHDYLY